MGCPVMMACHAVVQRIVLECLGIVEPPAGTQAPPAAILSPPAKLDLCPNFADDGFFAGEAAEVERVMAHCQQVMPALGLRFSSLIVAPAAGEQRDVDMSVFERFGCTIAEKGNVEILKSPCGDAAYCVEFCKRYVAKHAPAFAALRAMGDPQVVYYLLRWSANASRMNYLARTTPREHCEPALHHFDDEVISTFAVACGLSLDDSQKVQASFKPRMGGVGLRLAVPHADPGYLGSRSATHDLCTTIAPWFSWDADAVGSPIAQAIARTDAVFAQAGFTRRCGTDREDLTQGRLSEMVEHARVREWDAAQGPDARCRRAAYSSFGAATVLDVAPSLTLDKSLPRSEFVTTVASRFGVDVIEGGTCGFCGAVMDSQGRHCWSCMSGGDRTHWHHGIRDVVHSYCQRARVRPEKEAPGVLADLLKPEPSRRPADVLICASAVFARTLPDRSLERMPAKIAFDFAVVNALGPQHWHETLGESGAAATAYAAWKRRHLQTAAKCEEAGVRFQPMVFECQGGMTKETGAVLYSLAKAVASAEGRDADACHTELVQRLALSIARSGAAAIRRRRAPLAPARRPAPLAGDAPDE